MASDALAWSSFEGLVTVAGDARRGNVRARQRECGEVVVEPLSPLIRRYPMTLFAVRGKPCSHMVGRFRRLEVRAMATNAVRRCANKLVFGGPLVARLAIHCRMSPQQRKTCLLVFLYHVHNLPCLRRVASLTGHTKLGPMNIGVAG